MDMGCLQRTGLRWITGKTYNIAIQNHPSTCFQAHVPDNI